MFKYGSKGQICLDRKYSGKEKIVGNEYIFPHNVLKPQISIGCLNSVWYSKEAKSIL